MRRFLPIHIESTPKIMPRHFLFLLAAWIPLNGSAQKKDSLSNRFFGRKYAIGDTYRYRLTTESWQNGKWQSTTIAVCSLKVVADSTGTPFDEVTWISKKEIKGKDTIDRTAEAIQVQPYRISLHPRGTLAIPRIGVAGMTGEITDFNTFFVAVAPQLGIAKLVKKGDRYAKKDPVTGDFSNGKDILKGSDCLQVTLLLQNISATSAVISTSFMPPPQPCITFLTNDMNTPVVKDTINNFQMVKPFGNGRYNVLYGREFFNISTTLNKKDGKIAAASMNNLLSLKIKLNCGENYNDCQTVMPYAIERRLKLELMK